MTLLAGCGKSSRHSGTSMAGMSGTSSVCLIHLVDLVHLVSFVQPRNETDQIMDVSCRRTFSTACSPPLRSTQSPPRTVTPAEPHTLRSIDACRVVIIANRTGGILVTHVMRNERS